jgi:hypothetical protein
MVAPEIIRGAGVNPVQPPGASGKEGGWMKRVVYGPKGPITRTSFRHSLK